MKNSIESRDRQGDRLYHRIIACGMLVLCFGLSFNPAAAKWVFGGWYGTHATTIIAQGCRHIGITTDHCHPSEAMMWISSPVLVLNGGLYDLETHQYQRFTVEMHAGDPMESLIISYDDGRKEYFYRSPECSQQRFRRSTVCDQGGVIASPCTPAS